MNFCKDCNNMLYLNINKNADSEGSSSGSDSKTGELQLICKNCNYQKEYDKNDNSCLFSIDYNLDNIKKESFINPFIYDDITLPRVTEIKCPNASCTKPNPEIVYINYDTKNLKFIYVCLDCYRAKREPHIWG